MINLKDSIEDIKEALNLSQRLMRSRIAKKNQSKLAMGRARSAKRIASQDVLQRRSIRDAKAFIVNRMTKGKKDLSASEKMSIEKKLEKMKPRIAALAKKILPRVRERDRMKHSPVQTAPASAAPAIK